MPWSNYRYIGIKQDEQYNETDHEYAKGDLDEFCHQPSANAPNRRLSLAGLLSVTLSVDRHRMAAGDRSDSRGFWIILLLRAHETSLSYLSAHHTICFPAGAFIRAALLSRCRRNFHSHLGLSKRRRRVFR